MFVVSEGRSRTVEQFRALIEAAGLDLVQVHSMPSGRCVLECAAAKSDERR